MDTAPEPIPGPDARVPEQPRGLALLAKTLDLPANEIPLLIGTVIATGRDDVKCSTVADALRRGKDQRLGRAL